VNFAQRPLWLLHGVGPQLAQRFRSGAPARNARGPGVLEERSNQENAMKRTRLFGCAAALGVAATLCGCVATPVAPGVVYTDSPGYYSGYYTGYYPGYYPGYYYGAYPGYYPGYYGAYPGWLSVGIWGGGGYRGGHGHWHGSAPGFARGRGFGPGPGFSHGPGFGSGRGGRGR
jgi:hypothetical protein